MTRIDPTMQRALIWGVPLAIAAVVIGIELDWGSGLRTPPPETPQAPTPVSVGLLPEYAIPGGLASLSATSEHTLFNPTRRPAPPAAATAEGSSGPQQLRKGQFVLTGTVVDGATAVAYLKETTGGKSRVVKKGEKINGMLVADVRTDGVRFTLGNESEELPLKVASGPKNTVQPAATGQAGAGGGAGAAAAGAARARGTPNQPNRAAPLNANGQPASLADRRRAARETAAERAEGAAGGTGAAGAAGGAAAPNAQDPRWQQLFQRYNNRGQQPQ
jgi:hypothetical protein